MRRRASGPDSKTADNWFRAATLAAALGPAASWRSEALWRHAWLAGDEFLRQRGAQGVPDTEVSWDRVRLRLGRWHGADAPATPVAEGTLAQFRSVVPPAAGAYVVTIEEAASASGLPLSVATSMLLCQWDVASYVLPDGPMKGPVWGEITGRPPLESRTLDCLGMDSRMFRRRGDGPGGRVRYFGLVATATLRLPPGAYRLSVTSDDGVRLWLDDRPVLEDWSGHAATTSGATVTFTDQPRRLRVEYFQLDGPYSLSLRVAPESPTP